MDGDVLAKRKQTHPMPRRDGEGSVVTFYPLELAALLNGLLGSSIDATSGLGEVEGGGVHITKTHPAQFLSLHPKPHNPHSQEKHCNRLRRKPSYTEVCLHNNFRNCCCSILLFYDNWSALGIF